MNKFFTTLMTLAALSLAIPATAEDCWTTAEPEVDTGETGAGRFYVDNDLCQLDGTCTISIWVYQESNGIDGLQRGDEVVDNTCGGQIEADTIIL